MKEPNNEIVSMDKVEILNFNGRSNFYEQISDAYDLFFLDEYKPAIFPAHFHSSNELYYVQSGEIIATVNGENYCLNDGDLLFINTLDIHAFNVKKNGYVYCFQFGDRYARDFKKLFQDGIFDNFMNDKEKNKKIIDIILELANENQKDLNDLDKKAYTNRILSALLKAYGITTNEKEKTLIMQIIKFIRQNYSDAHLGLKTIAKEFNYSEVSISRFFSKYVGIPILQYINSVRYAAIQAMRQDEQYSNLSLTKIIYLCGFNSTTSFYRYKKSFEPND